MSSEKNPGKVQSFLSEAKRFFEEEIWTKDTATLPALRRAMFSIARIIMIVAKGFTGDNCSLQASALTYITLVSLVPMLAIMFSFSKGLGMQEKILQNIGIQKIRYRDPVTGKRTADFRIISAKGPTTEESYPAPEPQQPPTSEKPAEPSPSATEPLSAKQAPTANNAVPPRVPLTPGLVSKLPGPMQDGVIKMFKYVENTSFAALGLIGSLMLLVSVLFSMEKLEKTMNLIWGVKTARPWLRKVSDYLVVLILVPIVFLIATSINTLVLSNRFMAYLVNHWGSIATLVESLMKISGGVFILLGFALFFMLMPNTRVRLFPALVAGVIAGILWFIVQWAYMSLQVGLTNFNKIYGTFAVVPFFLAWIYANWSIVLFGAEVSFAIQNHRTIHIEKASESASTGVCIIIAQLILFEICKAFKAGQGSWNPAEYAQEHSIPSRVLLHVVDILVKARIILRAQGTDKEEASYIPGRDIDDLSPADVEEAFRETQSLDTKVYLRDLPPTLRTHFQKQYETYRDSLSQLNFGTLVAETQNASPTP
ncbi:MAG: YihY family inner membrane protein [Victivallales bacterium]|nr:YihY family inner membrane protein [Victivallales bacterium]